MGSKYDVRIRPPPPPPCHFWSDFELPPPSPLEQTSFVHAPLWAFNIFVRVFFGLSGLDYYVNEGDLVASIDIDTS